MAVPLPERFPEAALSDLDGVPRPLNTAWAEGPALIVLGHRDCSTTRLCLPWVDRIHRRKGTGTVLAILQDEPEVARTLAADLSLELPLRLEEKPYPLTAELGLTGVPVLMVVEPDGGISASSEGFIKADLEVFAARLGVDGPLFAEADKVPARRPG